ncbi:MAG TPA: response regulator transcription factor [Dehalococcoidia bacterium]|nr:response regulator transcription factor [Dehalococcoidia bacterium]
MLTIVVADGEPLFREGLTQLLSTQPDLRLVGEAGDARQAIDTCRLTKPDLALVAIDLPGPGASETARRIRAVSPGTRVIMLVPPLATESDGIEGADAVLLRNARASQVFSSIRNVAGRVLPVAAFGEDAAPLDALTPREREVFRLLAEGWSNRQIERALGIRASTVKRHVRHILRKLRVRNRVQAAVYAARRPERVGEGERL